MQTNKLVCFLKNMHHFMLSSHMSNVITCHNILNSFNLIKDDTFNLSSVSSTPYLRVCNCILIFLSISEIRISLSLIISYNQLGNTAHKSMKDNTHIIGIIMVGIWSFLSKVIYGQLSINITDLRHLFSDHLTSLSQLASI